VQPAVLDLETEIASIIICTKPTFQVVQIYVKYFDVEILFFVNVVVFKFMQIIVHYFLCHEKLVLNGWNDVHAPVSIVQSLMRGWLQAAIGLAKAVIDRVLVVLCEVHFIIFIHSSWTIGTISTWMLFVGIFGVLGLADGLIAILEQEVTNHSIEIP